VSIVALAKAQIIAESRFNKIDAEASGRFRRLL
jgi:hypothetical protein